jgi:excisionase family DNA binding protein
MQTPSAQLGLSIEQAAKVSSVGRSKLYEEISNGRLRARKLGRRTVILMADLEVWMEGLPTSMEDRA